MPESRATSSDSSTNKQRIHDEWAAKGKYWDRRADEIAEMAANLNQPLIDAARIEPGQHVLDLASGAGEPAIQIAGLVGETGSVTATDMVQKMLDITSRRAAAQGAGNMRFEIADMEALRFPDAAFDRVTCRFGIMFPPATATALSETIRVLKPGGRAAWLIWGPRENSTMFTVFAGAVDAVFGSSDGPDLTTPFKFAADGKLAGMAEAAGFTGVEQIELRYTPRIPERVKFWLPQMDMMMGNRLANATETDREAITDAVEKGFAAYLKDGEYHLTLHARVVAGDRAD